MIYVSIHTQKTGADSHLLTRFLFDMSAFCPDMERSGCNRRLLNDLGPESIRKAPGEIVKIQPERTTSNKTAVAWFQT